MIENYQRMRQRFLSDQKIQVPEPAPPLQGVASPPTPKIQNLKLNACDELEDLDLGASEDFETVEFNNFTIHFSTTAGDEAQPQPPCFVWDRQPAIDPLVHALRLSKIRSRSFCQNEARRSIYSYLANKKATHN